MSLDEKIKKVQEKIRQRIIDRQLQYQKEMSNISNEILGDKINIIESENLPVVENAVVNITTSKQPIHHDDELVNISEVEIFHQPDVIITRTDNTDGLLQKQTVKECLASSTESVQNSTLTTAGEKEVKDSSDVTELEPSNDLDTRQSVELIELKKEAEQSEFILEKDTPAPLEVIQSETPINDVKEQLNENMVADEVLSSDILKNEESRREVEISEHEKINGENTETFSEIKHTTEKPENVGDANQKSISMLSDSAPSSETEENKHDKNTIVIDVEEVIKDEQEEKEINSDQQITENLNTDKTPLDIQDVTEIGTEIDVKEAVIELNKDASESMKNTIGLGERENNYNNTVIVELQTGVDQTSNETVLDTVLENSATEEKQLIDKHPDPTAETITPAQHGTEIETLATTTHRENKELSNDHVDGNIVQDDIDTKSQVNNVTEITAGEKNNISTDLYVESDLHNNASNMKTDMTTENVETIENREGNGMDLETAAITIQKVFRTFLFSKSQASTLDDTANDNSLDEEIQKKVSFLIKEIFSSLRIILYLFNNG